MINLLKDSYDKNKRDELVKKLKKYSEEEFSGISNEPVIKDVLPGAVKITNEEAINRIKAHVENKLIAAAQGLTGVAGQQQALEQGIINQALTQGALERQLANQEAQANYREFLRQRDEQLSRIGILQTEASRTQANQIFDDNNDLPQPGTLVYSNVPIGMLMPKINIF